MIEEDNTIYDDISNSVASEHESYLENQIEKQHIKMKRIVAKQKIKVLCKCIFCHLENKYISGHKNITFLQDKSPHPL